MKHSMCIYAEMKLPFGFLIATFWMSSIKADFLSTYVCVYMCCCHLAGAPSFTFCPLGHAPSGTWQAWPNCPLSDVALAHELGRMGSHSGQD